MFACGADARPNWDERAAACLFAPASRGQAMTQPKRRGNSLTPWHATNCKPMSMYLNASILAGNTHMAASINVVANTDGKKTEVNQLIELMAELNRVKADLKDELDKVNADAERLRALNVSHR
jgi:hypothetical protein